MLRKLKRLLPRPIFNAYHWLRGVSAVLLNGYPARGLTVIGITGTDGKTTTSHLLYSILRAASLPASLISTTGAIVFGRGNTPLGLHVTTPNPFELQKFLREAKAAGSRYIVLETTSHGLAQYRVLGCNYQIGVITNITNEHLDYHGTYERYLRDKARLLRRVKTSILNRDDRSYQKLLPLANGQIVTYGLAPGADVTPEGISHTPEGARFRIPQLGINVSTRFIGDYNVANMLAAASAARALGIAPAAIAAGLAAAVPPPGRLEPIERGQPFTVYVDFAHTSNGLDSLLKMLHGVKEKRLIVVFGCAGERDPFKRYPMGVSAGRYADLTVITSEDPRTETWDAITDEVARGVEQEGGALGETYFRIPDRTEAIAFAIQKLAQPGDIVVATGKAHERSMCFGTTEYPWDEFAAVHAALDGYLEMREAA
jgi:UDP-N-acetylmuramoyl-L-alanyl-D-glutamate--2,6-diaminopimelate ligase